MKELFRSYEISSETGSLDYSILTNKKCLYVNIEPIPDDVVQKTRNLGELRSTFTLYENYDGEFSKYKFILKSDKLRWMENCLNMPQYNVA